MTSHDDDPDPTARLVASLTAPVVRPYSMRGEQSSGLFDLDSLNNVQAPPVYLLRGAERTPPLPVPDAAVLHAMGVIRAPRRIGWFATFVAWLATATLAMLSATQLPRHAVLRASSRPQEGPATQPEVLPSPAPAAASVAPASVAAAAPVAVEAPAATTPPVRIRPVGTPPRAVPRKTVVGQPPRHAAAAPTPASGLSLEALMRREVVAAQKTSQAAAKP